MLLRAIVEFDIDAAGSVYVGNQEIDLLAARRAGVRGVLYGGGDLGRIVAREIEA
jgi:D-glycero-D-manno-heptose 1,7-bisphosphate phosphatase